MTTFNQKDEKDAAPGEGTSFHATMTSISASVEYGIIVGVVSVLSSESCRELNL